ncbi:AraC family transcriptional regulator [Lacticaseibacillus suihuaensis]
MSTYIEIPPWHEPLTFRAFPDLGLGPVAPHRHKEIEIIQAVAGAIRIGVAGRVVQLNAGDVFLIASGQPHYFLPAPNSLRNVYQFDLGVFDTQAMQRSVSDLARLFTTRRPCSQDWPRATVAAFNRALNALFAAAQDPLNRLAVLGHLYLLLDLLDQAVPPCAAPAGDDGAALRAKTAMQQLNTIYDYIDDHYESEITLTGIASVLGFNPQYFARFFKKNTGTTFGRFLTDYRLMKACFLLVDSDDPMPIVAATCGFGSVKTFHHAFKAYMGVAPLSYRHRMHQAASEAQP